MARADKECILPIEEGWGVLEGMWSVCVGGGGVMLMMAGACLHPQVFPNEFTQEGLNGGHKQATRLPKLLTTLFL